MKRILTLFAFVFFCCSINMAHAQDYNRCGTDELMETLMEDEKFAKEITEMQNAVYDAANIAERLTCTNPIIIPIAVHYNNDYNTSNVACLVGAAQAQIAVLNEDFAASNTDISNFCDLALACPASYDPADLASNGTCIQFCLADQNLPSGETTYGGYAITVGDYNWTGGADAPAWSGYLNIFVDYNPGYLGIAPLFGGNNPNGNGTEIDGGSFGGPGFSCSSGSPLNTNTGLNLGRTATHELGHYFGLEHIFSGNNCPGSDGIADTPAQTQENYGCPTVSNCTSDANNTCNTQDYFFNYMDYVNDACMYMFTEDQANVMNGVAGPQSKWASTSCSNPPTIADYSPVYQAGCNPTPPNATFLVDDPILVCAGGCAAIQNVSTNNPTSYSWTFTVASGDLTLSATSSTLETPELCFQGTSGDVTISLTATNSAGTDVATQTVSVVVNNDCQDGCFQLTNIDLATDNLTIFSDPNGGFVSGSNSYGDESKADYFNVTDFGVCYGSVITSVNMCFIMENSPTGNITVEVWDGSTGTPGASLGSTSVSIASLTDLSGGGTVPTDCDLIQLATPITATGPVFVGISGLSGVTGGNIGLITNSDGEGNPVGWEEFGGGGGWFPYTDASSWGINIGHAIFPQVLPLAPETSFTVPTELCTGDLTFTDTTPALCSGAAPIYAWTIKDAGDNSIATFTDANPTWAATASGSYTVELCVTGEICESACTEQVINVVDCCPSFVSVTSVPTSASCDQIGSYSVVLDPAGDPNVSYSWTTDGGSTINAANSAGAQFVYTNNDCAPTTETFHLTVTCTIDNSIIYDADLATVTVAPCIDCDDNDPCTTDSCVNGVCTNTAIVCDDNDPNTTDACVNGVCEFTPIACTDNDPCTTDVLVDGVCISTPIDCDDSDPCTTDVCNAGTCVNTPIVCDDGDPCTVDTCDGTGTCVFTPVDCDDNDPCTIDSCDANGNCVNAPVVCDDGDPCTIDTCDGTGTCVFTPIVCDDNDPNTIDSCINGNCVFAPIACDDNNACTIDSVVDGVCVNTPVDCDDGDPCTIDACDVVNGCSNTPIVCDDGDPCTIDACDDNGNCTFTAIVCDDGDPCTTDVCDGTGTCVFTPVDCDDNDPCTIDSCDANGNCVNTPIVCDDGDPCTIDTCDGTGTCVFTPVDCDDSDPCTIDSCDANGNCVNEPIICDDGDPCTTDVCDGTGTCVFTPVVCDDGDPCTIDACDANGNCTFTPIVCDDGDPMTTDLCVNGVCEFIACDDNDPCTTDMLVNGVCVYTPIVCDDNDPCTVDSCVNGACEFVAVDCDDNDPCTNDSCDGNGNCVNTIIDSDGDGTADCVDGCPDDPNKTDPGVCGCGVVEDTADDDQDGIANCADVCPQDPTDSCCGTMTSIAGVSNDTEGYSGSILPTYYNSQTILIGGGTPPYSYDFERTGYVRWSLGESGDPAYNEELTIIYADNAEWSVTVTDANGCTTTALIFTNDSGTGGGNSSVSTIGNTLDIDNVEITGENEVTGGNNGAIDITVVGCDGGPYTYAWTGPGTYTSTSEDLVGIEAGFYEVTVTCGAQESNGWYWVPKDRKSGRLKAAEMGNLGVYPNPFAENTTVAFSVAEQAEVRLEILDVSGRLLQQIYEGKAEPDQDYEIPFTNTQFGSGVYLLKLTIGDTELVERMVILD